MKNPIKSVRVSKKTTPMARGSQTTRKVVVKKGK